MSTTALARRTTPVDARVLREAALRGKLYLRWPEDHSWLDEIEGLKEPLRQLQDMKKRGSLLPVGRRRWIIVPAGASSLSQAAPGPVLLAALCEGRTDWYLGFLSALIEHGLTDIDSETLYVAYKGNRLSDIHEIAGRPLRSIALTALEDDWLGVEIQRHGRVRTYRSDVERTLLDTLSHPRVCDSPEVWVRAWERAMREERVDVERLVNYSEQRSKSVQARCAFWLRETGHPVSARHVMKRLGSLPNGVLLDSSQTYSVERVRDRDTGLVINIPMDLVDGWLSYGK